MVITTTASGLARQILESKPDKNKKSEKPAITSPVTITPIDPVSRYANPAQGILGPLRQRPEVYVPDNYTDVAYYFGGGGKRPAPEEGQPAWMDVLDFISRPQRAFTGTLAEATSEGSSFLSTLDAFWKGLSGQEKRDFDEFLENLGWEDKEGFGWHDVVSFLGDVALDPLTYVTLGSGSVVKAGTSAGQRALREAAQQAGVQISKEGLKDFSGKGVRELYNATREKLIAEGASPETAREVAESIYRTAQKKVDDAAKSARFEAQNNLLNIDVPFTNITSGIGRKPGFLQKTEAKIGSFGASTAADILNRMGIDKAHHADVLDNLFGVRNASDLNIQQFDFLKGEARRFEDYLRSVQDHARILYQTVPEAVDVWRNFQFGKFVQDMGGRSQFGNMLGKVGDYFNTRTLRIAGEGLLNRAAKHIRLTHAKIAGQMQKMNRELREINQMAKGLSKEELEAIPYILENKFPESKFRPDQVTPQMQKVADKMRSIYNEIAQLELDAGILDSVRANYFPHVIKPSKEDLLAKAQKYKNDPEFSKLINMSASSHFSKERRSFQTMAQLDNYIASLENAKMRPDVDDILREELEEKVSILSNLFERNPIDALAKRYVSHINTRAMRELQEVFQEENIIMKFSDYKASSNAVQVAHRYSRLSREESYRLGLGFEEHVIDRDVYDALKKVESVFNEKGVAKLVGHFESVYNIWKMLVTTFVPAHFLYNAIGNVFNNYVAGVRSLKTYREATEIVLNARNGRLTKSQENLLQEAAERGILESGFSSDFTRAGLFDPQNILAKSERAVRDWSYTQFMRRNFGDLTDHITRLTHYMDMKRKLGSADLAAESVRKYLFNYTEMTGSDRLARLVIPFWNWTKNNVPLQIMRMAQHPRYYQTYRRFLDEINEDMEGIAPDWAMEEYMHIGGGTMWNPRLPVSDLNDDPFRMFTNSMNPLPKFIMEVSQNRNFFTGRPLDYDKEYRGESYDPGTLIGHAVGTFGGGVARRALDTFSGKDSLLENLRNLFVGRPINFLED